VTGVKGDRKCDKKSQVKMKKLRQKRERVSEDNTQFASQLKSTPDEQSKVSRVIEKTNH
jgi:hypothetical protein